MGGGGGSEANNPNGWGYSPGGEYKINDGPLVDMSRILGWNALLRQCNSASIASMQQSVNKNASYQLHNADMKSTSSSSGVTRLSSSPS